MSTLQLRGLLRTYLNYTARELDQMSKFRNLTSFETGWQGHRTGVPWKVVTKDESFRFIDRSCFPPGIRSLKKLTDMKHAELILWYQWILDGQEQRLQPAQVFQFARLPQPDGLVVLEYPEPIHARPSISNLTWSPEEKIYARRLQKIAEDAISDPSWQGLPLARLQEIYQPFSSSMKMGMSQGCSQQFKPAAIVSSLFEIERFGPVHVRVSSAS